MHQKPKWTGNTVKRMWENDVGRKDIADELGCSTVYIGKIFRGIKTPADAESKINNAIDAIIARRKD